MGGGSDCVNGSKWLSACEGVGKAVNTAAALRPIPAHCICKRKRAVSGDTARSICLITVSDQDAGLADNMELFTGIAGVCAQYNDINASGKPSQGNANPMLRAC